MKFKRHQTGRTAVVLAAGSGTRLGAGTNKVWLPLGGRELATWSFKWLIESELFDRYVLVVHQSEREYAREVFAKHVPVPVDIVDGGASRHASESRALEFLAPSIESGDCKLVLIHDGARPLAGPSLIREIVAAAENNGGALPYLETAVLHGSAHDAEIVRVQTPQVFKAKEILDAYRKAGAENFEGSDTSMCMEKYYPDMKVECVRGTALNIKVTYPQDLVMVEHLLASNSYSLK
jgi:2-C-methyl-D-erythritol 4-phosphate cytidylyltransferase